MVHKHLSLRPVPALFALGTLLSVPAFSQSTQRCGSDEMNRAAFQAHPDLAAKRALLEQMTKDYLATHPGEAKSGEYDYIVPMVFHIVHLYGEENISDAQVYDQMRILNEDFQKRNSDTTDVVEAFQDLIGDARIEFRLATKDMLGNCSNGIERHASIETFVGDDGSKLAAWARNRVLNIWVVSSMRPGVAGYAFYPSAVDNPLTARRDGIAVLHDFVGKIGTASNSDGRTLTHEVGHWINLAHTWGDTNDPTVECGDDGVEDTPDTEGHESCNLFSTACSVTSIVSTRAFSLVDVGATGTTDPAGTVELADGSDSTALELGAVAAEGVASEPVLDSAFAFAQWGTGAVDGETTFGNLTGAINTAQYYEFVVTPLPGKVMNLTNIKFKVARSATGPRTFAVRSSTANFSSNLTSVVSPSNANLVTVTPNIFFFPNDAVTTNISGPTVTVSGAANSTQPITFRIYAWNAEDADGYFKIDDLSVEGTFGTIENVQNYMEYAFCAHMFTEGQVARMRAALENGQADRNNLWSEGNLSLTGTSDATQQLCAPQADFHALIGASISSKRAAKDGAFLACFGDDVQFVDNSTNGEVDTWLWNFPGGDPASSTLQNPIVSYNTGGWKSATLTVGNELGSSTKTLDYAVLVSDSWPDVNAEQYYENFEAANAPQFWINYNWDNNGTRWERYTGAGFSGNHSMRLNAGFRDPLEFIDPAGDNDFDDLVTPRYDLSDVEDVTVSFRYAYATQGIDQPDFDVVTERLQLLSSEDCGRLWTVRETIEGTDLVTEGISDGNYVPANPSAWRQVVVDLPSTLEDEPNVRFALRYYSSTVSSNLYIDDFQLSGVGVGIADNETHGVPGLSIQPNPASASVDIIYAATQANPTISLLDLSGRVLFTRSNNPMQGKLTLTREELRLANGAYLVSISTSGATTTRRLVLN
jgi:PKD repeat protein